MATLKLSGEQGEWVEYSFRASGPIQRDSGEQEEVSGHEITGTVGPGEDEIPFSGVPLDFEADKPWSLDIKLDMGAGFVDWRPTHLNALTVEVRREGWYELSVPEPGMIFKGEAPEHDGVLTDSNTFAAGNVVGGLDRWVVWPHVGLDVRGDHDLEWRYANPPTEWETVSGYAPEMSF